MHKHDIWLFIYIIREIENAGPHTLSQQHEQMSVNFHRVSFSTHIFLARFLSQPQWGKWDLTGHAQTDTQWGRHFRNKWEVITLQQKTRLCWVYRWKPHRTKEICKFNWYKTTSLINSRSAVELIISNICKNSFSNFDFILLVRKELKLVLLI